MFVQSDRKGNYNTKRKQTDIKIERRNKNTLILIALYTDRWVD
jgi:hypothetical protein